MDLVVDLFKSNILVAIFLARGSVTANTHALFLTFVVIFQQLVLIGIK